MPLAEGRGLPTVLVNFKHQGTLLDETLWERGWCTFWEMGCGKSRPTIHTCTTWWRAGKLDGVIVVAPNGVHRNWISDELPAHCDVPWRGLDWHSDKAGSASQRQECARLVEGRSIEGARCMPWLAISYDGLLTTKGLAFARLFAGAYKRFGVIVDEGSRIKNPDAKRSKQVLGMCQAAALVRVLNGTPVANAPLDVYSQMRMIDPLFWRKRGISTWTAFRARFAVLKEIVVAAKPDASAGRVAPVSGIVPHDTTPEQAALYEELDLGTTEEAPDVVGAGVDDVPPAVSDAGPLPSGRKIQVVAYYRDLDALRELIKPYSSRLTKEEAGLNLPPKVYTRVPFELTPEQRRIYDRMRTDFMVELDSGALVTGAIAMVRIMRLQQIACGFLPDPEGGEPAMLCGPDRDDPRVAALVETLESIPGKGIIWARFRLDVDRILRVISAARLGGAVRYDGAVTRPADRAAAIDRFRRDPDCRWFVANAQAIGMGVTLTEATNVVYYSQDFSLINRLQSEDRAHRIGQTMSVTYHDLVAIRTVDEKIRKALLSKQEIAAIVTGDRLREWFQ